LSKLTFRRNADPDG